METRYKILILLMKIVLVLSEKVTRMMKTRIEKIEKK